MKATLTLIVDIGNPADEKYAKETLTANLDDLVQRVMDESLITEASDLEIVGYSATITVTADE